MSWYAAAILTGRLGGVKCAPTPVVRSRPNLVMEPHREYWQTRAPRMDGCPAGRRWRDVRYAARYAARKPRLCGNGYPVAGTRCRCQHGDLQHPPRPGVARSAHLQPSRAGHRLQKSSRACSTRGFAICASTTRRLPAWLRFAPPPHDSRSAAATERVTSVLVSGNYFDVLGVKFAAGSGMSDADDAVPGSGGRARAGRGRQLYSLAGPIRRAAVARWLAGSHQRTAVHGRWNHGSWFSGNGSRGVAGSIPADDDAGPRDAGLGSALTMPRSNWIRRDRPPANRRRSVQQAEAELTSLQRAYNQEMILGASAVDEPVRRALLQQRITLLPGSAGSLRSGRSIHGPLPS